MHNVYLWYTLWRIFFVQLKCHIIWMGFLEVGLHLDIASSLVVNAYPHCKSWQLHRFHHIMRNYSDTKQNRKFLLLQQPFCSPLQTVLWGVNGGGLVPVWLDSWQEKVLRQTRRITYRPTPAHLSSSWRITISTLRRLPPRTNKIILE